VIVPLTTSLAAMKFQGSFSVLPSTKNGLTEESVVLTHQLRAIDCKRIKKKIGCLSQQELEQLQAETKLLLGF
jgi:mRNA-degrading endonuclease toxin of MazEF toxin-antitoxin module